MSPRVNASAQRLTMWAMHLDLRLYLTSFVVNSGQQRRVRASTQASLVLRSGIIARIQAILGLTLDKRLFQSQRKIFGGVTSTHVERYRGPAEFFGKLIHDIVYPSRSLVFEFSALEQTLIEYKIKDRLGYPISDNATTNDACVEALTLRCCPELMTKEVRESRRLRCSSHIVNLCAKALTREDIANNKALKAAQKLMDMPTKEKTWRQKEPRERCEMTSKLFRISPLRTE
ncbi:hypothetical protein E4U58_003450 [Claviceps cyperi]|nr:hypothetical protein E4U58_003450 [Claviceps cyperi]